ncbi:MAG: DEAD/DEAH box helicase, partial [Firmicutes bacterium]|nr:DEAD/DEAH box helicase [Bacillota bacterium]
MEVGKRREDPAGMDVDALQSFHPMIRDWFRAELGEPSEPQARAWPEIARGSNVLIVAPTGAGKTLAAFLKCIDSLISAKTETPSGRWVPGVRVLYVSPLKALNNDIYRNLEVPLRGIQRCADRAGVSLPEITKAVRTGDTPSFERQRMLRRPPDILITTPESLYLILTSARARDILRTVQYVIVDEIHAVCGTKRGTHLALSLERLCELTEKDPVRIGLSATIEPAELAAAFLGGYVWAGDAACEPPSLQGSSVGGDGTPDAEERDALLGHLVPRNVKVVKCSLTKEIDVKVMAPVDDYRDLQGGPLWTAICSEILEMIRQHRSTLVFVNNRRAAEIVAAGINGLAGEEIAKSHHGSVSKEARMEVESLLKKGQLPCLVATSSLELGIDIGAIDLVVQIESPTTIAQVVQRIGRSGHRLDAVSKGVIMTKTRGDLLRCAFAEAQMEEGYIEAVRIPEAPLDVLAQQVVACAAVKEYTLLELYGVIRRAYPYRALSLSHLKAVLAVLSDPGGAGEDAARSSKPRIVWDAINDKIRATPLGRMVAISHSGTIIDRGYYQVCLAGTDVKLGELDEEFVTESRRGEKFTLGTSAWRIERIERDRVIVTQAPGGEAKLPFWRGEGPGRPRETGLRLGRFIRTLQEKMESGDYEEWIREVCHPTERVVENLRSYIEDQIAATGAVPTDRRIVVEHFSDEAGEKRILVHCPLGSGVNAGLGFLLTKVIADQLGCTAEYMHNDDGILIHV